MKRFALAFAPLVAIATPAIAEPAALPMVDFCATYTFAVDGRGEDWTICRAGSRVFTEDRSDLHKREVWDYATRKRVTIYVREQKYSERVLDTVAYKTAEALRPRPLKMMSLLTDPEIYRFERVGTETLDGREVVKWRISVRPDKDYLAFPKRGHAWTAEGNLLLKIEGDHDGRPIALMARDVEIGPPNEARFAIPRGFKRID